RAAITAIDPTVPIYDVGGIDQLAAIAFIPARTATAALGTFGLLALVLAIAGTYGTAAYAVSRRIREIGVRVALGAKPADVLWFVLRRTALLLAIGALVGLGLALASAGILADVVYQSSGKDPMVLSLAALALVAAGVVATGVPARRALSVDPLQAIRTD